MRFSWFYLSLPEQADQERVLSEVRAQLGEAAFAAAWEEGQAMTLEQAVEYALEGLAADG